MARDPYDTQDNPYSSWRSGSWGGLMDRTSGLDRIVGKDMHGEYTRGEQISSNFAGAAQFLANDDLVNKFVGGPQEYSMNTEKGMSLYKKKLLKRAQQEYDYGISNDFWEDDEEKDGAFKKSYDTFDDYAASNPIYAAAQNDKLFFDEEDGMRFEDLDGDLVGLRYNEDDEKHFDPSTLSSGYKLGYGDTSAKDEDYQDLMSYMGYETNTQKIPKLDSEGNIRYKYYDNVDKGDEYTAGVDNYPSEVWQKEGIKDSDADFAYHSDPGEGHYKMDNPQLMDDKDFWKRSDDFSTNFEYDYEKDYTLKNLTDKDWYKGKIDKVKGKLGKAKDNVSQAWDNFTGDVKRKAGNIGVGALSDKYDEPMDAFNELLKSNEPGGQKGWHDSIYSISDQLDVTDNQGNKLDKDQIENQLMLHAVQGEDGGVQDAFEGYDVQWGKEKDLYGVKTDVDKRTEQNQVDLAQSYIDKDWAPDNTIDQDTYEELGGKHTPKDGSWDAAGANLGSEFKEKLEGNLSKAYENLTGGASNAMGYLHQNQKDGTTEETFGEQVKHQRGIREEDKRSQEEEDYYREFEGYEKEQAEREEELQTGSSLAGEEDMYADTLEADPAEWDKRRGLGDNLLKLVKGDFAGDREDQVREIQNLGNLSEGEQRQAWEGKFKELGVGWQEFKDSIGDAAGQAKDSLLKRAYDRDDKKARKQYFDEQDRQKDLATGSSEEYETDSERNLRMYEDEKLRTGSSEGDAFERPLTGDEKAAAFVKKRKEEKLNKKMGMRVSHAIQQRNIPALIKGMKDDGNTELINFVKENYPDIYKLYEDDQGNQGELPQNNLMRAWENENIEPGWDDGSSATNQYDEPNYNFNPGGL
tara:strand:- start:1364 stop:3940 length:2577 start_codon:yes stop_codon:yes gene_type:complete